MIYLYLPGQIKLMKLEQKLHNLITYLFYFLIFFTPLVFFRGVNELFEFPKMTFVYLIGSLIIFLFLIKRIIFEIPHQVRDDPAKRGHFKMKKTKLLYPVLIFLFINVVSTIFSMNTYTSTWGYYTRFNGGLASIAIFALLYLVLINELSEEERNTALSVIVLSSIPVCLYAIAQNLGFEKGYWEEDSQARVFSTLGQPNWLAAYLLLTFFPALFKLLQENKAKYQNIFFSVIVVLNYASLWFTYSLSGLLGFSAGLAIFLLLINKSLAKNNQKTLLWILTVCLLISVLRPGVIKPKIRDAILDIKNKISNNFSVFAKEVDENKKNAFGDTTAIRLIVWQGTKNLILSSPKNFLIGSGPETFPYAFPPFRPTELNQTSEWDFIFNKPHNYYLELAANLGILGLLSYVYIIKCLFTKFPLKGNVVFVSALTGLFISDFFSWHVVATSLLFYVYLALLKE